MAENYVATEALFIGRARAHNPGDVVPAAHVEKYGWADMVVREGSEAAREVPGSFDPAAHSVNEVVTYLEGADDAERARVVRVETAGKGRKGVLGA